MSHKKKPLQPSTPPPFEVKEYLLLFRYYKYVFLASVLSCLIFAFFYQYFNRVHYRVESTFKLQIYEKKLANEKYINREKRLNYLQGEAEVLRDTSTLRKAILDLSLQTRYYTKKFLRRTEIYGDSLPLKITLSGTPSDLIKQELKIKILNQHFFEIKSKNVATVHRFGQTVKMSFVDLKVLPGPAFNLHAEPVTIRFISIEQLLNYYHQKLKVNVVHSAVNTLELSLVEAIPQKGKDFLNQLIQIYTQNKEAERKSKIIELAFLDKNMQAINQKIKSLNAVEKVLHKQHQRRDAPLIAQPVFKAEEKAMRQRQIYSINAIKPYVLNPVQQFTIIPDNFDLGDWGIRILINKYNLKQLEKQVLLKTKAADAPAVLSSNQQLLNIQKALQQSIAHRQAYLLAAENPSYNKNVGKPNLTDKDFVKLARKEKYIQKQALLNIYDRLAERRRDFANTWPIVQIKFSLTTSPSYTVSPLKAQPGFMYSIAFLFGIAFPIIGIDKLWVRLVKRQCSRLSL